MCILGLWMDGLFASTIVNIESLRLRAMESLLASEDGEGFAGRLEARLDSSSGNVDKFSADFSNTSLWARQGSYNIFILSGGYGESFSVRNANRLFVHLRHVQDISPNLAWEAFTQGQKDEFKRLRFRGLAGGGLRWPLWPSHRDSGLSSYMGLGAFYSREDLDPKGLNLAEREEMVRINSYLSLLYQRPQSPLSFSTTVYFQPQVDRLKDFHLFWESSLNWPLTPRLGLRLSLDVVHDNWPPAEVKKTDRRYRMNWTWSY